MVDIFRAGGVVMWPLLLFSILAIALIIERLVFWLRITRRHQRVVRDILKTYKQSPIDVFPKLKQNIALPTARIFLEALELEGASPNQFRLALESATQAEFPKLKRFNTLFDTVISVSPLLGLLGTILGLISSFEAIQLGEIGTGGNAELVTGGISQALVSTAAGLVVAIFTLLFANLFRSLYKRQAALIQEYGGQLEILYERRYEALKQGERAYAST